MLRIFAAAAVALVFLASEAFAQSCSSYPYTLTNGTTADANQVTANFNCAAKTYQPTFSGTTTFSTASGNTIVLDRSSGAAAAFFESGVPKFLIEDDTAADSSLGFYSWNGSSWSNLINFKNNGMLASERQVRPTACRWLAPAADPAL